MNPHIIIGRRVVIGGLVALLSLGAVTAAYASNTHDMLASNGAHVTGIAFSGNSASAPVITITGKGFGAIPNNGTPSSDGGCGYGTGSDYGTHNLWVADATGTNANPAPEPWSAGENLSATNLSSCLGLFITSWTNTQVVFSFGSRYGPGSGNHWVLRDGDALVLDVKGSLAYAKVPSGF